MDNRKLLADFITRYCNLSDQDLEKVLQQFSFGEIAADTVILRRGQTCDTLSIILKGAFRLFAIDEAGNETTTWLVFENTLITEPASFLTRQPSRYYLQALEHSQIASIHYDHLHTLYQKIPGFESFGRKLMEEILVGTMCRATSLLLDSPQERYNRLLQHPRFLQRVPLKHLASFIGITPSSLSRLRRRMQT
ncbi:Crp/Fnr family transcriptional regulator [Chitinophaga sp. HK235]|uniref:Crp/Fnr family transcriptional regulator n=1 Tax=Chitinophaga sp. HK235 TaxID=2952571 RepID=UPI001BA4B0FC|nr:cyclic nucleotide-binding domain-containing protein [Chitinophaga sp. HK235]